jgi:hypothetical protein
MHRLLFFVFVLGLACPTTVIAQDEEVSSAKRSQTPTNFKGMASEDLKQYCIYGDQLYSRGSWLCSDETTALECQIPDKADPARWVAHRTGALPPGVPALGCGTEAAQ